MQQTFYKTLRIPNLSLFSLAPVVVEQLLISQFFFKIKSLSISGTQDETWQQKLAADLS